MIKSILLSLFIFITLSVSANFPTDTTGLNQSIMFSTNEIYHIDLKLSSVGDPEMKATGIIGMVTGLSFITAGVILESNRIARNQPEVHGYSASANRNFNYFVISLGGAISVGSVWYYIKGCK